MTYSATHFELGGGREERKGKKSMGEIDGRKPIFRICRMKFIRIFNKFEHLSEKARKEGANPARAKFRRIREI